MAPARWDHDHRISPALFTPPFFYLNKKWNKIFFWQFSFSIRFECVHGIHDVSLRFFTGFLGRRYRVFSQRDESRSNQRWFDRIGNPIVSNWMKKKKTPITGFSFVSLPTFSVSSDQSRGAIRVSGLVTGFFFFIFPVWPTIFFSKALFTRYDFPDLPFFF